MTTYHTLFDAHPEVLCAEDVALCGVPQECAQAAHGVRSTRQPLKKQPARIRVHMLQQRGLMAGTAQARICG